MTGTLSRAQDSETALEPIPSAQPASRIGAMLSPDEFKMQDQGEPSGRVLEAITLINKMLLAPKGPDELFTDMAHASAEALGYPFMAIVLFDNDMRALQVTGISNADINRLVKKQSHTGIYNRRVEVEQVQGETWAKALLDRQVYVTSRPEELLTPFAPSTRPRAVIRRLNIKMGIAVPLVVRAKVVGGMMLGSAHNDFRTGERTDLLALAQQVAVAIEMGRLYDHAEGRTAMLRELHTLSQSITGILDLDKLYTEVARAAGRLTNIDFCTVNTLTEDKQGYRNNAAWGEGPRSEISQGTRTLSIFPVETVRKTMDEGEPIIIGNLSDFPQVKERLKHRRAGSLAVFPFKAAGKAAGFVTVGRDKPGEWSEADIELLKQLSDYVTIAFTNARLYTEAQRRAERMTTLHSTGQQLARIHDVDLLFNELREAVQRTVDAPILQVALWDNEREELEIVLDIVEGDPQKPRKQAGLDHGPASRAIRLGTVYHIDDLTYEPAAESNKEERGTHPLHPPSRAVLSVPLLSGNRAIGALTVESYRAYAYSEDDVQILQILAGQAAVTLDNIRLLQTEAQRTAEQAALARSARMIARAETNSVIQTIAEAGNALMMDSQFGILLPDSTGELVCVAAHGPSTDRILGHRVKKGEGLLWRVFEEKTPLMVSNIQTAAGSAHREVENPAVFRSWMAVPMQTEQECIGVLAASHAEADLYKQTHLDLLSTMADHATIALENERLLKEAKMKAAEQAALAKSAHAIALLDIDTVLQTIVDQASEIVKSSRASLRLYDENTQELYWAAGHNNSNELKALRIPVGKGIVGQVFATGEPLLIKDLRTDPRTVFQRVNEAEEARSAIAVPLRGPNGNIGVLANTHHDVGVFTERDLDVLTTFADYATIALSNAHLYSSLEQREEERTKLLHQLLTSQEAERRRVAVDIHDGPLQSIGVNILAVDRARKLVANGNTEQGLDEFVEMREGLAGVVQELRDVINDLRPVLLERQGLVVAITAHLKRFTEQYGTQSHLEDYMNDDRLPVPIEVVFYRLLQESLTNVRKHAAAKAVWVKVGFEGTMFKMSVTDNGCGFDPEAAIARSLARGHIGLHSMMERVDVIGGGMEIDSTIGSGSRITFWAPVR